MTTQERMVQALNWKRIGCNCAQAVLCAYEDRLDLSTDTLKALGAGFGGGMGTMEGTCGALCAAEMVLGLTRFTGKPLGASARALHQDFAARCGATLCRELKGRDTGVVLCPCPDCIQNAVACLEDLLDNA